MSEAQSDAAKRAAARKAKILARGNTGLAKLAQTARGEEAEKLYGGDSASSSRPATPLEKPATPSAPSANTPAPSGPSWIPPSASAGTAEQRQMQDQLASMMSMLGGGSGQEAGNMPDMSQFFASMMGGAPPNGQNLLGDLDDPAGLGGLPPGFPNLPGMEGLFPGVAPVQKGKAWVDKIWPVVHAVVMVVFVGCVVLFWEPSLRNARWGTALQGSIGGRWARLCGRRGVLKDIKTGLVGGVEIVPVFWAFTTLELILQTTRFFILRSPPPPHSLIQTFLPLLPPVLSRPIVTGSRYLTMLTQLYKDGALLIFLIGMLVVVSDYTSSSITI